MHHHKKGRIFAPFFYSRIAITVDIKLLWLLELQSNIVEVIAIGCSGWPIQSHTNFECSSKGGAFGRIYRQRVGFPHVNVIPNGTYFGVVCRVGITCTAGDTGASQQHKIFVIVTLYIGQAKCTSGEIGIYFDIVISQGFSCWQSYFSNRDCIVITYYHFQYID